MTVMTTQQALNLEIMEAKNIISIKGSSLAYWLKEKFKLDDICFTRLNFEKQNLLIHLNTIDELSSLKRSNEIIEGFKITWSLKAGQTRAILSYLIREGSLPFGSYEIIVKE